MIQLFGASFLAPPSPRGGADASARRRILGPVDFRALPGTSHLLLGQNGSGKTTLIRILAGLAAPTSGEYRLDGRVIAAGVEGQSLWPEVAALFEEPDPQFLADTVEAEVAFGVESLGVAPDEVRERTALALREYDVAGLADRAPQSLSAGEKARVLLAAAVAGRPRCLILDQTLSHLDPGTRRALEERLAREALGGARILVRTHQEAEPPFPGETLHLLEGGAVRPASQLTPQAVVAATRVPFPLALRASALLAIQGRWTGPLAVDAGALSAVLGAGAAQDDLGDAPVSPASGGPPALAMNGVAWSPPGHRGAPVLADVTLEVARGEIVALIGRSGTGKTTLLKLCAGLMAPTAGSIHREAPPIPRTRPTALTMEYPERQLFARTVIEDVAALLWVEGVPPDERDRSARRAMAEVGLDPEAFAERFPLSLSEGEKRRTALAGALVEPPHVLLLDEPTAGLDPGGRRSLARAIHALRERGRTVVFASHDLDFVGRVADRVVVLARDGSGRIFAQGPAQEVLRRPRVMAEAGLPQPDFILIERALRVAGLLPPAFVRDEETLLEALARGSGGGAGAAPRGGAPDGLSSLTG